LIYARSNGLVLMLHRNASGEKGASDPHRGKWNGLGGKFEVGESPVEASRREFEEESGIRLEEKNFMPLGVLQFPDFNPGRSEDWIVYVFEAVVPREAAKPGLMKRSPEGDLHWIEEARVASLPLWEGDREFLPWVLKREPFVGTYWYEEGRLSRSWLAPLSPSSGTGF
jgi:8-oxo-dGTP diphosphatase